MELEYKLRQTEEGVFGWKTNEDPPFYGTIGLVTRQEAERTVNEMNEVLRQPKWNVGDVVQLKPGGPPTMVVFEVLEKAVICRWMKNSKVEKGWFPKAVLQAPQAEDPAAGQKRRKRPRKNPPA